MSFNPDLYSSKQPAAKVYEGEAIVTIPQTEIMNMMQSSHSNSYQGTHQKSQGKSSASCS